MSQHHEDFNPDAPYGVICPVHGKQGLDVSEYELGISLPDMPWICPVENCGRASQWDDVRFEIHEFNEITERTPDYDEDELMEYEDSRDYPWEYGSDE